MKKFYSFFALLLIAKCCFATTHIISVSNNQFTPLGVNVNVGDTILWKYVEGFHTTTSLTIPSGATSWDAPLQTEGSSFKYKITVAGTYNYDCTIHGLAMSGTITASGILPVTLSNFTVAPSKVNAALIAWSTASEQNVNHFEVMRSLNGVNFEKIASIPAKGNSTIIQNYSYTDNALPASYRYVYYSLNIVDNDGKRSLSEIKMFSNINGSPKLIVSLSPNPISRPGHLMLQFNSDKNSSMHVQLFDQSGKLVKETDLTAVEGLNNGHFHIGDVAPGVYTIRFTMDALNESYKIVVR